MAGYSSLTMFRLHASRGDVDAEVGDLVGGAPCRFPAFPTLSTINRRTFNPGLQDFRQLASSINSGDLAGAQQAYAALSQDQSSGQGPFANPNSPASQALNQIGTALQNGDLSGAQQALSSLQQAPGGHHHHGHHGGGSVSPTAAASPSSDSTNSSTSSILNITA
jgi:hypothetical protein